MGVHGLTTFLREKRAILSKTINFSQQDRPSTPLVVDGWSFIYKVLEDSGLPWVYGGEYEAFYHLVVKIVKAWIAVGLRPIFVFDGSTPPGKLDTAISRLNQAHVQQALLFFRTSAASRNTRRFLNEARIIPPLALTVCVHALLDFQHDILEAVPTEYEEGATGDQIEIHFADEEADPYAVELAGRLGAYVAGRDSDFVVLNSEGYLGYVPLEEMVWLVSNNKNEQTVDEDTDDGFQSVKKKKRTVPQRMTGFGVIPPDSTDFSLSVSLYTPASLAQHLNLPVSILPLLGALVGNDYTLQPGDRPSYAVNPRAITSLLFERRLTNSQRITHASTTLNTLLFGRPGKRAKKRPQSVMELIQTTVEALAVSSGAPSVLVGPDQQAAMVERIVEGTLPYAMPLRPSEDAFLSNTVCALHLPHECRLVVQMDRAGMYGSSTYAETVSALYLRAYRLGKFSPYLMDILSTRTFWPDIFLENPDVETVSRSISRYMRQFAYSLLEDGIIIPAPLMPENEEESTDSLEDDLDELVDVVEESEDEYGDGDDISADVSKLRGELRQLQFNADERIKTASSIDQDSIRDFDSVNDSVAPSSSVRSPAPLQRPTITKKRIAARCKTVTEYVRRGARVVAEEIEVTSLHHFIGSSPPDDGLPTIPFQLRSEDERIAILCSFLRINHRSVLNVSEDDRMPILCLRLVISRLHERAEEATNSKERQMEKWTRKEARAFLASMSRSPEQISLDPPSEVSERSIQLTAQILTALECIEHVVQVLLLTDTIPACAHFFSGLSFHSLLASSEIVDVSQNVWEAVTNGLEICFAEERQGRKTRRKAQKAAANSEISPAVNGRGKMTASGSLYSLLSDLSA
ncbi:hypothetical protein ACEPAG_5471 [Sanghuangporus baumii]